MEIRRPGDGRKTGPLSKLGRTPSETEGAPSLEERGTAREGDAFRRSVGAEVDAPFWLIAMAADRAAGRRFLDDAAHRAAAKIEAAWIARWRDAAVLPPSPPGAAARGKADLDAWQALVEALCAAAQAPAAGGTGGSVIGSPRVVWQPSLGPGAPARGQYLFKAEGGLLQLRPGAPGTDAEWLATVAHETFHHAQHALIAALYQGKPLPAPYDQLAGYYRDARIAYRLPGPTLPPRAHAAQALEVGAWAFGRAIAAMRG